MISMLPSHMDKTNKNGTATQEENKNKQRKKKSMLTLDSETVKLKWEKNKLKGPQKTYACNKRVPTLPFILDYLRTSWQKHQKKRS